MQISMLNLPWYIG